MHRAALSAAGAVKGGVNVASACERGKQSEIKDLRKAHLEASSSLKYFDARAVPGRDDAKGN